MEFDDLLEFVIELGSIIVSCEQQKPPDFSSRFDLAGLSAAQVRTVIYFQLCAIFGRVREMTEAYEEAIERGVQFSKWMYSVVLACATPPFTASSDAANSDATSLQVLQQTLVKNMINEGLQPGVLEWRILLEGARNQLNPTLGIEIFKLIEKSYGQNS